MEHMVLALVPAGTFDREHIQRLFHHADYGFVAAVIGAVCAGIGFGDVQADGTEADPALHIHDGLGQC